MNLFDALAARAAGEAAVLVPRPVSRFAPGLQSAAAAAPDAVATVATVSPGTRPPPRRYRPADEPPQVAAGPPAAPTPFAAEAGPQRGGDGFGDPRRSAVTPRAEPGSPDVQAPEPRTDADRAGHSGGVTARTRVARGPRSGESTSPAPTPHEEAPELPPIAALLARSHAARVESPEPAAIEPAIRPGDHAAMGEPRAAEPTRERHPSTASSAARRPTPDPPLLVAPGTPPVPAASRADALRVGEPTKSGMAGEEQGPVIEITIGRVEVRAVTPPSPKPKAAPTRPRVSLEEYLHRRPGRTR